MLTAEFMVLVAMVFARVVTWARRGAELWNEFVAVMCGDCSIQWCMRGLWKGVVAVMCMGYSSQWRVPRLLVVGAVICGKWGMYERIAGV